MNYLKISAHDIPRGFSTDTEFRWPLVRMADVVALNYGKALVEGERHPGAIPVYGTNGRTGWHSASLGSGPTVVLGRKGMGNLGVEWCPGPFWVIDTAYYTTFSDGILPRYFYYFTMYVGLNHLKDGTSNPSLSRDVFGRQVIPLPPLKVQNQIADLLGALDDKIDLNRRMNETLEAMARAIFKDWFVDFGPTKAKMEGRPPYLARNVWSLFPDRLDDDGKPEGWKIGALGDLGEVKSGKRPEGRCDKPTQDSAVPLWGGNGPMGYVNKPLQSNPVLLTGRVGTLGSVFRIPSPCWPSDNTLIVEPISAENFDYLYFCMKDIDFQSLNRGSTQPLLTQTDLKAQPILLPSHELLTAFDTFSAVAFARSHFSDRESYNLSATRDLLLPRLMSGETRIKDAEKVVEEVL